MKTAKYERCMKCGGRDLRNIVVVERGDAMKVYVECIKCESYVCMYTLRRYTSDQTYEGLLATLSQTISTDRRSKFSELAFLSEKISKEFTEVKELAEKGDETRRVEVIMEEEDI